jgi:rhamnose transport system substrate-binding protein
MAEFIEDGICPQMYLWNPVDIGYLAGYTMHALENGTVTGASGEELDAGKLGTRTITEDFSGGSEVVLGDLLRFDSSNINEWQNEY